MRIQVTFSKTGALRYVGNLDLLTIWERAVRRAGVPLAYSQGFHPQPKLNLPCAWPVGFSRPCKLVDLRLKEDVDLVQLRGRLQAAMPAGIRISKAESVDEHAPPLQTQVLSAEYEVTLAEIVSRTELRQRIDGVLNASSIPRQRRGKAYDLRPLIEKLELIPTEQIFMRLAARAGATCRAEEVLDELGIQPEGARIERTSLIFLN